MGMGRANRTRVWICAGLLAGIALAERRAIASPLFEIAGGVDHLHGDQRRHVRRHGERGHPDQLHGDRDPALGRLAGYQRDALGYTGSSFVTMQDVPDSDPSQHYVWFAKLDPTHATGTDTEICASVRALVPVLTPDALK